MCGVVGIFDPAGRGPEPAELERMLDRIRHRGPDAAGIFVDDHAGLGLARLSIVDLEGGLQPLGNEDGSVWVICNGEVFNHVELRAELRARGHRFRTGSDCETIVHAYEEHGEDFLHLLNGQFACAVWDRSRRRLLLARDRLGVRPLYYVEAGGRLLFASEIKALLADPQVRMEIDPVALGQAFTYWAPQPPRTMFEDVRCLRPGHLLEVGGKGQAGLASKVRQWWRLEFAAAGSRGIGAAEAADQLRALLEDATRIRLRADVPVGSYLSGGLDSTAITALARRHTNAELHTFSVAFSDQHFDESRHQQLVAAELGTTHHTRLCTAEDIGAAMPEVVWHTETPILRTAPIPLYLLARRVHAAGLKVVLTGEGSDEFQIGYDIFKETAVRAFWARDPGSRLRPRLLRRLYGDIPELRDVPDPYLQSFFGTGLDQAGQPAFSHLVRWGNGRRLARYLSPEVRSRFEAARQEDLEAMLAGQSLHWDAIARAQYNEAISFLDPYLLSSQGDRVAMANAVEGRFPFLDHRVVEYVNGLPSGLKMPGLSEKALLKRAVADLVPATVRDRPKRPFRAPIQTALVGPATPGYVEELCHPISLGADGYLQPAAVRSLVEKAARAPLSEVENMALIGAVSFGLFRRAFWAGRGPSGPRHQPPVVIADLRRPLPV